jgi:type IV secretion system protein VirD4
MATSRFNPLDFVRAGIPEEVDDAAMIADMLVVPGGDDTFWDREAQNLIATLILYVVHQMRAERRTLHQVWALLMQEGPTFRDLLVEIAGNEQEQVTLRRMAQGFLQKEEREWSGVVSTAQMHMSIWKSPLLAAATEASDFRLEDLRRRPTTLYIIVPPDLLDVYRPFVRLMVGLSIAAMTRTHYGDGGHGDRVLFLLDEVAALGRMSPVESGISYLAGYDVTLWLFFQDLDQLQKTYAKWRSIVANCNVRQAFGVSDYLTAQELSSMLGHRTVRSWSRGHALHSPLGVIPGSLNRHVHEAGRALLTPDEVMTMRERQQLIFLQACRPILADKIRYFAEPSLTRRIKAVNN